MYFLIKILSLSGNAFQHFSDFFSFKLFEGQTTLLKTFEEFDLKINKL